ncbi:hypothetical protein EmuJ_000409000 [Echinococcus multilocularis]|uniref:Uncharacterized protein n=1 Tax=Echinococcus multilocularis TaxID=6211 RepID=A0A068XTJ5_ECHMU|nr:hypothetical protein EmuJ_000409000 [Echinococcus multilocularis]
MKSLRHCIAFNHLDTQSVSQPATRASGALSVLHWRLLYKLQFKNEDSRRYVYHGGGHPHNWSHCCTDKHSASYLEAPPQTALQLSAQRDSTNPSTNHIVKRIPIRDLEGEGIETSKDANGNAENVSNSSEALAHKLGNAFGPWCFGAQFQEQQRKDGVDQGAISRNEYATHKAVLNP